jgi:ATP-dependent Lon protease
MQQEVTQVQIPEILPILPARDTVIFPRMVLPLMVREEKYIRLIEDSLKTHKMLVVSMVKDPEKTYEGVPDMYEVGTACQILRFTKGPDAALIMVQGIARVRIMLMTAIEPYPQARIERLEEPDYKDKEIEALMASIRSVYKQIVEISPHLPPELMHLIDTVDKPGTLADMSVSSINIDRKKQQKILESVDLKERLKQALLFLNEELEVLRIGKDIQDKVREGIDKSQREYYLREQLKAIQRELGMKDEMAEIEELREKLKKKKLPDHVREVAEKEIDRLSRIHPSSAEYPVARTYIDWLLELPWMESTEDNLDVKRARKILDKYHYNLEKVKKRILEYLAVRKLNPEHKGPILCFVGPPGTGKTSLGRAIAEALGRKFVRVSLGGIRDEAEIRGHRRTYVGALPGRIIQGIRKAGSNNPVFMLDEIDKIGLDFRGDPASALLEVLDPEQNYAFSDHYLEVEFDLSKVMFITTANQLDPIPAPLRDRMEILELTGYTEDEKVNIAKRFIIPKQVKEHGLEGITVQFRDSAIRRIIREYTREAGLRNLEREIGAICRGIAIKVAEQDKDSRKFVITKNRVQEYLGKPKFTLDVAERTSTPGVAIGMAWTPTGGEILFIEATIMPGEKSLVLTGQLGDVMKESAQIALSYLRSRAEEFGIDKDFYKQHDIHIHVPAGAIPKDGPSAGITMLTALASLLLNKPVKPFLAMTGEVTLRGLVLPVGGIKDKVLAASRSGIKEVIIPSDNKNDLDEIPAHVRKELEFHLVKKVEDVLKIALP